MEGSEPEDDPYRVPVVVGVARLTKGPAQGFPGTDAKTITSPVEICMEAVKAAAADSGAGDELLKRIKIMGWPNVNLGRETNDPCWLLEKKLGGVMKLDRRRGYYGGPGSSGQLYMNDFAYQLASGVIPKGGAALVAMGEARHSIRRMRRHTKEKGYKSQNAKQAPPELRCVQFPSPIRQGEEEQQRQENTHGLTTANYNYSLYENGLRASAGRTIAEHKKFIGEIFAEYSRVATTTPEYSWFTKEFTPSEITDATPDNRMISGPFYTKQMCAFNDVDM